MLDPINLSQHSMKRLLEKFRDDPVSTRVINELLATIETAAAHPLLNRLHAGNLSIDAFMRFSKIRLEIAKGFVPFLEEIVEKANRNRWSDMGEALTQNLNDECGIKNGQHKPGTDHDTWRRNYRKSLARIYPGFDGIDVERTVETLGREYSQSMERILRYPMPYLAGAFVTLEAILSAEFSAQQSYIDRNLSELTPPERLYIDHHAGHEHGHIEDAALPMLEQCAKHPDMAETMIEGIKAMATARIEVVLDGMEAAL